MDTFVERLIASPALYPISFDPATDRAYFLELSEPAYVRASFLDPRFLGPDIPGTSAELAPLHAPVAAALPIRLHFIFHISHVGSTLVSRLLGAHPRLFSLREPLPLRAFARDGVATPAQRERLDLFLRLWSRTWRPEQRTVVKATSFANVLAKDLLGVSDDARALALMVTPPVFLATILPGQESMADMRAMAQVRTARLAHRLGQALAPSERLSPGELVALTWACETLALADAARAHGPRFLWLDFDRFLTAPDQGLTSVFRHFGVQPRPDELERLVTGPIMGRYSKLPDHPYTPKLRAETLAQAARDHAGEITKGLAWLDRAAALAPIREVLEWSGRVARS